MFGEIFGQDWGRFGAVFGGLLLFGFAYNHLIGKMEEKGYAEGFVSLLVALGELVTLGAMAFIDPGAALLAFLCNLFSGPPMIVGSIWRYIKARQRSQDAIKRWGNDYGDRAETLAE